MLVFVMYYIYVTSGSSLLIESTDSMINTVGRKLGAISSLFRTSNTKLLIGRAYSADDVSSRVSIHSSAMATLLIPYTHTIVCIFHSLPRDSSFCNFFLCFGSSKKILCWCFLALFCYNSRCTTLSKLKGATGLSLGFILEAAFKK